MKTHKEISCERRIREAMGRLLNGEAKKTNGKLTAVNLAKEAGVSKATLYRYTPLVEEFRQATASARQKPDFLPDSEQWDLRLKKLERLNRDKAERIRSLEATVQIMCHQVHLMSRLLETARTKENKIVILDNKRLVHQGNNLTNQP